MAARAVANSPGSETSVAGVMRATVSPSRSAGGLIRRGEGTCDRGSSVLAESATAETNPRLVIVLDIISAGRATRDTVKAGFDGVRLS